MFNNRNQHIIHVPFLDLFVTAFCHVLFSLYNSQVIWGQVPNTVYYKRKTHATPKSIDKLCTIAAEYNIGQMPSYIKTKLTNRCARKCSVSLESPCLQEEYQFVELSLSIAYEEDTGTFEIWIYILFSTAALKTTKKIFCLWSCLSATGRDPETYLKALAKMNIDCLNI